MPKHLLLSIFLCLWTQNCFSEAMLRGQIVLQNSNGKVMSTVQISVFGTNPTTSNSFGQFQLTFPEKKPGDQVTVNLKKDGFEVVNTRELRVILRANPDELVEFVMCAAGERDRYAKIYYAIAEQNINQRYDEEIRRINANYENSLKAKEDALREKNDALQTLGEQYKTAIAQAQDLADKFAEVNLDEASELYKQAFELFKQGKITEAIAVLDNAKMEEALKKAQDAKQKAEAAIEQSVENYILKARLCKLNFQFTEAETCYQKAVDADPTNFYNLWEFGYYLYEQNQFHKALPVYEQARSLAQKDSDVAAILNSLGVLYYTQNQFTEAAQAYQRALKIREQLAQAHSQTSLLGMAMTLNNLGVLYYEQNQFTEAAQAYQRAIDIRKQLAQANPQTYLPDVAMTLNNLGNLYAEQNQFTEAAQAYQRALEIREQLAQANPQTYLPDVAATLNNLGVLYADQNQFVEAAQAYQRALEIREQLAQANPQAYDIDLCGTLINVGKLHLQLFEETSQPAEKEQGVAQIKQSITLLQKYPNLPHAQEYLGKALRLLLQSMF